MMIQSHISNFVTCVNKLFTGIIFLSIVSSCSSNKQEVQTCDLNLQSIMQKVPESAKFINDSFFIWGGSMVKSHVDEKYHLFYSRWPKKLGMNAWVTHSEIAHAVSDSPFGPFEFKDVTLPVREKEYWDGLVTHNPTIHYFNGKYYLYYMGNTGDGKPIGNSLNWTHRNNQRIGVAIADNPNGPWERFSKPLIDVSPDTLAHDALMVSNPSVTKTPDDKFLMVYKAVAKQGIMPFGGPVVHLTAVADNPEGPFIKQMNPVFTAQGFDFPAEDPFVWYEDKCYYAIVKDMNGAFTDAGRSLALFRSEDGLNWKLAKHPLVSNLEINWENGLKQKVTALERPQLFFENGEMVALLCAVNENIEHSFNVQIPLLKKK
jgi:predicted GH43/DUF377 family glycosyl hydrolase